MHVLVTGATGFLGRHLVGRLLARGERVRVLVRPQSRHKALGLSGVEVVLGDLKSPEDLRKAAAGVEVVYHCAALVAGRGTWEDFEECNIRGTERLLAVSAKAGARRFVHVSSLSVYGPAGDGGREVKEEDGYDPYPWRRGFYTWSKIEADRLARSWGRRGDLPTVVLRPGILWSHETRPFVARLSFCWKGRFCLIVGSPHTLLPLTHVESVVDALLLAGEGRGKSGEAYNVVDPPLTQGECLKQRWEGEKEKPWVFYLPFSWVGALLAPLEAVGKGRFRSVRYRLLRACQSAAYSTAKARQDLGWAPREGLVLPGAIGQKSPSSS